MSVTKRISGDYNIVNRATGLPALSNVTVSTHTLYVDGNLVVGGTANVVTRTDLNITDNTITLNSGETGAGVTLIYSGIQIDRGSLANVGLRWNENFATWQITTNGTVYGNIATTSGGGGSALTAVVDDPAPELGGNLNITGRTLYNTSSNVALYSSTVAGGGSGIFVNANGSNNQELVTQSKALAFSIIFG